MKPSLWIMIKRLPRAIRLYFMVKKMFKSCGKEVWKRNAKGYFKLALAWS